jgi:peptidoglycan-associated lipoprotein
MRRDKVIGWGTTIAIVGLCACGCATKGFVRSQVADLRADVNQIDSKLQSEDKSNADLTADALARADSAYTKAGGAWSAALGRVGLREASRSQIYFAYNSAKLSPDAQSAIGQVVTSITNNPQYAVQIFGFTDPAGPDEYNYELGRRRAEAVERFLVGNAPGQLSRYQTISFGEEVPAAEASFIGAGKQRRQVLVVLIERIPIEGPRQEGIASR